MLFLEEGVRKGDLRNQDLFTAFVTVMGMGSLGGLVFLKGENMLMKTLI